jgi:hypothetical protein
MTWSLDTEVATGGGSMPGDEVANRDGATAGGWLNGLPAGADRDDVPGNCCRTRVQEIAPTGAAVGEPWVIQFNDEEDVVIYDALEDVDDEDEDDAVEDT